MKLTIDADEMTLGEVEFFEEESGLSFSDLAAGKSSTKGMLALITIQERRTNPAFTMDDARAIKLGDIEVETADPPAPAKKRAPSKA